MGLPIKREVPQEHSHNAIIASVRTSLNLNNPDKIQDPIFGLLGDAAAAAGAGDITNLDCLQQDTADQAFTNAKAAGDVAGMTNALIFRALERNTGKVGLASVLCTETAQNPEIAAITQHQDPASAGAAATNKAIVLALAQQIHSVGGNPLDAIQSGTFAPGNLDDSTGKGNTCDVADDTEGCIFSQNLLVADATDDEINAAVGSSSSANSTSATDTASASDASNSTSTADIASASDASNSTSTADIASASDVSNSTSTDAAASASDAASTAVVSADAAASTAAAAAASVSSAAAAPANNAAAAASSSGANLQTFTGALGGLPPPVTAGGKGFVTDNSDFVNLAAAIGRSCDVQHNACSNQANSGGGFSVSQCDTQDTQCKQQG